MSYLLKSLTFIFLIISSGIIRAQAPEESLINQFFARFPSESVYLQLDNDYYFPGDTIWYKAYVMDNGALSLTTKSLYVDWFDGNGFRIAHQALPLFNGMGAAQYALPPGLAGKRAHVAAYTRWMLNDSG